MKTDYAQQSNRIKWAQFRFSIIGPLLAAPPPKGQLTIELEKLGGKIWTHPITSEQLTFHPGSIERWFYAARASPNDPILALTQSRRQESVIAQPYRLR